MILVIKDLYGQCVIKKMFQITQSMLKQAYLTNQIFKCSYCLLNFNC